MNTRRGFLKLIGSAGLVSSVSSLTSGLADKSAETLEGFNFEHNDEITTREGLGIVIVGASSGLGAEMARQYANHTAYIVLAGRRTDKLGEVAAEVAARGSVPYVVPTDVRNEGECIGLIDNAISWLGSQGKAINLLALAAMRIQIAPFGPQMSSEVWQNCVNTGYFGPAYCLKHALPHLKQNHSTIFYFNSVSSSFSAFPHVSSYSAIKHAWRGIMNSLRFEHPDLTIVSSNFNAIDTEGFRKELTCFNNDKRYCPGVTLTYSLPEEQMYPEALAVEKAIQAIESGTPNAFLSLLNNATWLVGFTQQDLAYFLLVLEWEMGFQLVQQLESEIRQLFEGPGGAGYINRLLHKLDVRPPANELIQAAALVLAIDRGVALNLLALDDLLDPAILASTRQRALISKQGVNDGSAAQLLLTLSSGTLSPPGIADDNDGFAPVVTCPPAPIP